MNRYLKWAFISVATMAIIVCYGLYCRQYPPRYEILGPVNGVELRDIQTGDFYYNDTMHWFKISDDGKMVQIEDLPK